MSETARKSILKRVWDEKIPFGKKILNQEIEEVARPAVYRIEKKCGGFDGQR